jgi:hypothetical protein
MVVAVVMRVDARLHPHDVLRTIPTGNIVRFVLGHLREPLCITAGEPLARGWINSRLSSL